MTRFSHSGAAGETTGGSFRAREWATAGEREDQLPERSDGPESAVLGVEAIDLVPVSAAASPAMPIWPPPGARTDAPRVTEFTVSTSLPISAAGNLSDSPKPNLNPNLHSHLHLDLLPQEVVSRICAISITNDSSTRPALQATSKSLSTTVSSTPDAWDTFEVTTGTPGSLTAPSQVAEYIQRSGARPLSVALTVARPQDQRAPENVQAILKRVVDAAGRIEDLILDVHCDASEHALVRLFTPARPHPHLHPHARASALRRLALVGKLQLDYLLAALPRPAFSSLRHLTLAYCAIYALDATLETVESLKLGVTFLAPPPGGAPLVALLRAFPSVRALELQTLTYAPGYSPHACARDSNGNGAVLHLAHLAALVLDSIPLDCELFASLRCPRVRRLVLKDVVPEGTGDWDVAQRFDEFVAGQAWAHLEALEVDRVYEGVRNRCIELVKVAEGRLKELTLGGFAWDACKALMAPDPMDAVMDVPRSFPALERLVVRLDDTDDHHQLARQAWMDGLQQFALGRIVYDTVADVLFRGYQNAPRWLQALGRKMPSWRLAHTDGLKDDPPDDITHCPSAAKIKGSTRTLKHISLETSFNDSYAFIWNEYEHLKDIYDIPV